MFSTNKGAKMNTLPASEVKRRGVLAFEESLKLGPVHIIKSNKPMFVVLKEADYQALRKLQEKAENTESLFSQLLAKPATGRHSKKQLDTLISKERADWDK